MQLQENSFLKKTTIHLLLLTALVLLVRVPLIELPLERDEGEYAYIAWRLSFDELPYRDWIDQKPPAIFWVYRAAMQLPIDSVQAIHLAALTFVLMAAVAIYFFAIKFTEKLEAFIAAAVFIVMASDPSLQGVAANTELFMLLPIIIAHLLFLQLEKKNKVKQKVFLIGIFVGIASAFKQVAAVNWLFFIIAYQFYIPKENRIQKLISFSTYLTLGIASLWATILIYFYNNNSLNDLIYNVFTHNLEYINTITLSERLQRLTDTTLRIAKSEGSVVCFALLGIFILISKNMSRQTVYLSVWLITSAIGVSMSGYFFPHYFLQIVPSIAILAAVGAAGLYRAHFWKKVSSQVKYVIVIALVFFQPLLSFYPYLFQYSPSQAMRKIYPGNYFAQMPALGNKIREITSPDDKIFIFGAEPELLFYSRRASATKYIFLFPLYGPYKNALKKQKEVVKEISQANPDIIVNLPNNLFFLPGTEQYLTHWVRKEMSQNFSPLPNRDIQSLGFFGKSIRLKKNKKPNQL